MFEIPSWLNPPNYLAAMQGGAGIGLHQREQDFAEQHAADALRESYAHLASQQSIAQLGVKAAAARQQAALELRKAQLDSLSNYRQDRLDQGDDRLNKPIFHFGQDGSVLKLDPASGGVDTLKQGENPGGAQASIATLEGAPGFTFLKNPSGAMTPLIRPAHAQSSLEKARLLMSGINAMAPRGIEDYKSPNYQARTNALGAVLRSLDPQGSASAIADAPKAVKDRKANTSYKTPKGVFNWTGSGWSNPTPIAQPQTDLEDAE